MGHRRQNDIVSFFRWLKALKLNYEVGLIGVGGFQRFKRNMFYVQEEVGSVDIKGQRNGMKCFF